MTSFEQLEQRRLLSADGTWTLTGTDAGESITIDLRASDQRLRALVNGEVVSTRLLRGLKLIEVLANGGNDVVRIDLHDANPGLGIWVNGGPGRDRIYGGAGDENLGGGSGRDFIDGGRGNDIVRGGTDRDDVAGGDGDDYVQGNAGNDTLAGGWGNDRITGGSGVDQIRGGAGNDRIAGGKDADVIKGGAGNDLLEAGGGTGNTVYRQLSIDETVSGQSDRLMDDNNADDQSLTRMQSDAELKQWLIDRAVAQWQSSFGQETSSLYWANGGGTVFLASSDSALDSALSTSSLLASDASQTNAQESGVDEADIVETDGKFLYILRNDELIIADADPAADLKIVSRTKLDSYASGIYLDGNRVTVLSSTGGYAYAMGGAGRLVSLVSIDDTGTIISPPEYQKPQVQVTVFDVSDRAHPSAVSTTKLDGNLTDSRVIDGRLYVVVQNYLAAPTPKTIKTGDKEFYESESAYRARLEADGVDDLIPTYTTDAAGASNGSLLHAPDVYVHGVDRLDTTSVTLIDLRDPSPAPISTTAIVGANGQVYASQDNLYLAGSGDSWRWGDANQGTELFKFGLGIDQVSLAASGKVDGTAYNRFAMDEEGEFFRVATGKVVDGQQNNGISVLDQIGDDLSVIGQVKDLGIGESIQSARFIGDRAYLVTFLRTDPLFTIDLSEPTAPKMVGELTIPGFSNYLHPIGNGDYLIGLGFDASDDGRATNLAVSLFNVADPAHPTRVDQYKFDAGYSIATYDPHAFSYFPDQGVLAFPISDGKLAVLHVDLAKGFSNLGTIDSGTTSWALRSVRIGSNLFAIGSDDVRAFAFDDLGDPLAVLPLSE